MACFRGKWIISNLLSHQHPSAGTAFVFQLGLHNAHPQRSCAFPSKLRSLEKKKMQQKKTKNLSTGRLRCFQTATLSPVGYSEFRQTCANSNRGGCKQQHDSGAGLQAVGAAGAHRGTAAPGTKQSDGNKPGLRTTQNSCCSQSK